ncbi:MAG: hypothetical protein ACI4WM_08505 [Erysipelotrichaceae bacterium]
MEETTENTLQSEIYKVRRETKIKTEAFGILEGIEKGRFDTLVQNIKSLITRDYTFKEACELLNVDEKTKNDIIVFGGFSASTLGLPSKPERPETMSNVFEGIIDMSYREEARINTILRDVKVLIENGFSFEGSCRLLKIDENTKDKILAIDEFLCDLAGVPFQPVEPEEESIIMESYTGTHRAREEERLKATLRDVESLIDNGYTHNESCVLLKLDDDTAGKIFVLGNMKLMFS